jgi:transposase
VHAANELDTVLGCEVFQQACKDYQTLKGVCADADYRKTMEEFVQNALDKTIEISARISKGWSVLTKRWVVERTFSWLNHYSRLLKDYEVSILSTETYVMIAHSILLIQRLGRA